MSTVSRKKVPLLEGINIRLSAVILLPRGRIARNAECCNSYGNSVCLSVRLSVTRWYPIQTNEVRIMRSSRWGRKITLVLCHQERLAGDVPFHLNVLSKCPAHSEKRWLWPISAYNVWTVTASEKVQLSRIGSRTRAFQRAIRSAYVTWLKK